MAIQELTYDPLKQFFRMSVGQFEGLLCKLAPCLPRDRTRQGFDVINVIGPLKSFDWSKVWHHLFASKNFETGEKNKLHFRSAIICCVLHHLVSSTTDSVHSLFVVFAGSNSTSLVSLLVAISHTARVLKLVE